MSKRQKKNIQKVKDHNYTFWFRIIIVISVILLYGRTINYEYVMDDSLVVVNNEYVNKGLNGIGEIFSHSYLQGFNNQADASYRPLPLASYAIEKSINDSPGTHHSFHLLYLVLGLLVWFSITDRLFKGNTLMAFVAIMFFVLHPVHTEVIANIKSRDEILLFLTSGISIWALMKYLNDASKNWLWLSMLCYLLALLSKESATAYLLLFPLFSFYMGGKKVYQSILSSLPFLLPLFTYLFIRNIVLTENALELTYVDNILIGTESTMQRLSTAIYLLGLYVYKLFFPLTLSYDYSFNELSLQNIRSSGFLSSLALYLFFLFVVVKYLGKKKIYAFGIAFFMITIAVASNILVLIGTTFAERLLFVPAYGFCLVLSFSLFSFLKQSWIRYGSIGLLFLLYGIKSTNRISEWKNDLNIFKSGVETSPNSTRTNAFYGFKLFEMEKSRADNNGNPDFAEAKRYIIKSIEISGDFMAGQYFAGLISKEEGNYHEAKSYFERTLELDAGFEKAKENLAIVLINLGSYKEAEKIYDELLSISPENFDYLNNYGHVLYNLRSYVKAEEVLLKAYAIDPDNRNVLINIVRLYRDGLNNIEEALKYNDQLKLLNQ